MIQHRKVVTYELRQLKDHEKNNYTTHYLELAAVTFDIKVWRHYLHGETFNVYTDYKSLTYLF